MFEKDIKLQPTSSATWNDALLLGFIYLLYRIHFSIRTLRFHFLFSLKCRKNLTCLWKILVASSASHSLQEDSPRNAAPVHLSWFLLSFLTDAWNCFKMSGDSPRILGRFSGNSLPLWHLIVFIYLFSFFFLFVLGRYFSFTALKRKRKFFGALEELFWIFPHILWIVWRNSFARLRFSEMLRDSSEPIFECWWSHEWSSLYSSRVSEILVTSLNIFWRRFDSFEYHFPDIPRDFPAFSNTLGAFFWGMIADS